MTPKYWCKHFVPFVLLREPYTSSTIRNVRCWVLDNVESDEADIFASDVLGRSGISFAREEDLSMFLLMWT